MQRHRIGSMVRLDRLPRNLLPGLPLTDRRTILAAVGGTAKVAGYRSGDIELEFRDAEGDIHTIWIDPSCVSPPP